jgi:hypothetical protein
VSSRSLALGGLAIGALTLILAACSTAGDLLVTNESPTDVTVSLGDEQAEVTAGGGVEFLGYGCTPGDVAVEFPAGRSVVVTGPICPEQVIVIRDGTVDVESAATN